MSDRTQDVSGNGTSHEPGDGEVVADVLDGRRERYAILVRRHQESLFRHARGFGLDPDTAADMVQDTLVRAFESLDRCQDPDRFGSWAGRILRNRCLDHLKSASEQKRTAMPMDLESTSGDPARRHELGGLREALGKALNALPPEQKEGFLLKHVEGRSYEEMAEMAEVSVSAMKMRVHRAREALKEHLTAHGAPDMM